tara:strand:+ start:547 stop:1068 length:522 start_codon:yes stop_codon:yes gene_type:complete
MLIKQNELVSLKENKVTLVKNFFALEKNYDFNLLSQLMEENQIEVVAKTQIKNLKDVFQMYNVTNYLPEFQILNDFLSKLFKYERHEKDNLRKVDLFFSFISQTGNSHIDAEDVFIFGLKGKTIYRIFNNINENHTIEEGDMIFIPRGIKHKVIGLTPRIVASIGFFGKRNNG